MNGFNIIMVIAIILFARLVVNYRKINKNDDDDDAKDDKKI